MTKTSYDALNAAEETTCELKHNSEETETQFWYADQSDPGTDNKQSCTGTAIQTKLQSLSATKIASGKLKAGKTNQDITKDNLTDQDIADGTQDDGDLSKRMINTSTTPSKFYYLVVKYPNTGDQSSDAGNTINVTLSIDGPAQVSLYNAE